MIVEAFAWLADPETWAGPNGMWVRIGQHLAVTFGAVAIAAIVTIPVGVAIGHARRGAEVVGGVVGAARAIPTLGLLTLFGLWLSIGLVAPMLALIVLAIPSLLAGAYAGVESVNRDVVNAATAIGMSGHQVVARIELPLALPIIIGGIRAAVLQVVATATLAAFTSDLGLGRYMFLGLKTANYPLMLASAVVTITLALILELSFAMLQRLSSRYVARR